MEEKKLFLIVMFLNLLVSQYPENVLQAYLK